MAHALHRVSLSTARPADGQFAFVSHNPGSVDAQLYCHVFQARHARAVRARSHVLLNATEEMCCCIASVEMADSNPKTHFPLHAEDNCLTCLAPPLCSRSLPPHGTTFERHCTRVASSRICEVSGQEEAAVCFGWSHPQSGRSVHVCT